ncbi:MAG: hypothetical protein QOE61_682 [Micromonosporaceae bacterium]|nr:hypothetical protein [Micromonosporaceae bacterium]
MTASARSGPLQPLRPRNSSAAGATDGWCQRWRSRHHSWRHTSEGGFDPNRYVVTPLAERPAREFVTHHHYSATWPSAKLRYGLVDRWPVDEHTGPGTLWLPWGQLVGTLVLGVPMQRKVLTGPFPTLEPYHESLDLSRLVILDSVPANAESWFCARVFELAAAAGIRGIVAFSDPIPRWRGTDLILPGHVGTIYQASNFIYTGRGTPRTLILLPDGTALTARAAAKVTGGERGRDGVVARLVAQGATPPAGEDPAEWLAQALHGIGVRKVRHPGNHRYIHRIGRTRAERTRVVIGMSSQQYPKRDDAPSPAGTATGTHPQPD